MNKQLIAMLVPLMLTACVSHPPPLPNKLYQPNRVVRQAPEPSTTSVKASFGYGQDPSVQKAYRRFLATGKSPWVRGDGFLTVPFDEQSKPILFCAVNHLCVITLAPGELINDIHVGDRNQWLIQQALLGGGAHKAYQVSLTPKVNGVATDLLISTTAHSYHLGLISDNRKTPTQLSFYYPQETLRGLVHHPQRMAGDVIAESTLTQVDHLNFAYRIDAYRTRLKPLRVFDDGHKTFIQMPKITNDGDLPVLYLKRHGQSQLVNYRYHSPYFVIDGLIDQAYLISGKGHHQARVTITRQGGHRVG